MRATYKPDRRGTAQLLKDPELAKLVHRNAEKIADNLDPDLDIVVDDYTTDRVASSVTIREPQALLLQARDGTLTRAAAAAGLEVRKQ
jgi:hypothetical protein